MTIRSSSKSDEPKLSIAPRRARSAMSRSSRAMRVAVVLHPETPAHLAMLRAIQAVASPVGVTLTIAGVHNAAEIELALTAFAAEPNGGLIILPHPVTSNHRELLISLAVDHRLPPIAA